MVVSWLTFLMMVAGLNLCSTSPVKEMEQIDQRTYGTLELCDKNAYQLNGTWSPKIIKTRDIVLIHLEYTFNAEYKSGKSEIKLYFRESEKDPWILSFGIADKYSCDALEQYMHDLKNARKTMPLKCPYQKGDRISLTYNVPTFNDIPSGYYLGKIKVTNAAGHVYLCAQLSLYVADADQDGVDDDY